MTDAHPDCPCKDTAISMFAKSVGQAQAESLWNEACAESNCSTDEPDMVELENIFRYISQKPGRVGVQGMSLRMRLMAYQNVSVVASR